jgi:hypothetical protein
MNDVAPAGWLSACLVHADSDNRTRTLTSKGCESQAVARSRIALLNTWGFTRLPYIAIQAQNELRTRKGRGRG